MSVGNGPRHRRKASQLKLRLSRVRDSGAGHSAVLEEGYCAAGGRVDHVLRFLALMPRLWCRARLLHNPSISSLASVIAPSTRAGTATILSTVSHLPAAAATSISCSRTRSKKALAVRPAARG